MRRTLVSFAACLALAGCGGGTASTDAPETRPTTKQPQTFTVSGFVTANGSFGLACAGTGAWADLHRGTRVVVRAADGSRLGSGVLEEGFADDDAPQRRCIFEFSVPGVPEGDGPFLVQVAERPPVSFERRQAGQVAVTLGRR
jgi:hypothetical protein